MPESSKPRSPFGIGVNSYNRMQVVLGNMAYMPRLDWFAQLGDAWTVCDNVWQYRKLLKAVLCLATADELLAMMNEPEREARSKLSDSFVVHRECFPINRVGLSWTTDEDVARRIVTLNRYRRGDDFPILRTGRVRRDRVVLKLDRGEAEIIAPHVYAQHDLQLVEP